MIFPVSFEQKIVHNAKQEFLAPYFLSLLCFSAYSDFEQGMDTTSKICQVFYNDISAPNVRIQLFIQSGF